MNIAEGALANQNPIYEAEYALEKKNPLKLFDSFVPALEEHRKLKGMTVIQQMKYQQAKRKVREGREGNQIELL